MEMVTLFDALQSQGVSDAVVETVADRFMTADFVTWSDVHAAGICGRDIARLRRHVHTDGKVCCRLCR